RTRLSGRRRPIDRPSEFARTNGGATNWSEQPFVAQSTRIGWKARATMTIEDIAKRAAPRLQIVKRSMSIAGHRTSISLEEAFWRELKNLAAQRGQKLSALVAEIDASRSSANLSSAIRVFLLERLASRQ
ncbi:MAG TPA: ribbon-helix-helix domain-containing protein, partial [Roseiarcus sp.]|nr:ribbon-helix-helix domain-containing protein [Roseiarcus sp.]